MTTTTTTLATTTNARYTDFARGEAIGRGLAIRTIGVLREIPGMVALQFSPLLLLEIEGSAESAERWISENGAPVERAGFEHAEPARERTTTPSSEQEHHARALVLRALDSYGSDALILAEQARDLYGIEGIESVATTLANENNVERAWFLRGALAALLGEEIPEIGGAYESDAGEGFDFVEQYGALGAWS
jgi:hypothetical protein